MLMSRVATLGVAALLTVPLCGLAGCSTDAAGGATVVASFYPLQFVAERIVGDHAKVENLTAPGVEPHDLELTPKQVAEVGSARAVLYERGLQPSVDQAVDNDGPKERLDTTGVVKLHAPAADGGEEGHEDDQGDPHFWQDPTLLAEVATAFAAKMEHADPAHADAYRANNAALQKDFAALDADYRTGLRQCRTRTLVVSHDAFEYLGRRYHLDILPIAGLSPDAEPSPKHLQQLSDLIRSDHITTVFSERLGTKKYSQTLASDLGIKTAVLDPIEGLTSSDPNANYLTLMRQNLRAIQKADSCS